MERMKKEEERQTSDALQKKADAKLKASKDKRIAEQMSQNSADPALNEDHRLKGMTFVANTRGTWYIINDNNV